MNLRKSSLTKYIFIKYLLLVGAVREIMVTLDPAPLLVAQLLIFMVNLYFFMHLRSLYQTFQEKTNIYVGDKTTK